MGHAMSSAPQLQTTPYELLGGNEAAVRRIVDRFYDTMESAPDLRELRAMHAPDLGPMRDRLSWFLTGWLGGPPRYAEQIDAVALVQVAEYMQSRSDLQDALPEHFTAGVFHAANEVAFPVRWAVGHQHV